jgi:competence protein ComGC
MQAKKDVSLIASIIVSLVLAVLSLIALPRMMEDATIAKTNACQTNVKVMNLQIGFYYHNKGEWPLNFNALINDPNYFPDGLPECLFGHVYTMHSSNRWINQHNH